METAPASTGSSASKAWAIFLVVMLAVLSLLSGYSILGPRAVATVSTQRVVCDTSLEAALQAQAAGLCLENIKVSVSTRNASELVVPVIVMNPASTGTMEILYLLNSQSVGWPVPHRNVTEAQVPVAITVPSGKVTHDVVFSDASLLFSNKYAMVYSYTVTLLGGAAGYYAILPPYYVGMYPALAVGANPYDLNETSLSMWGYSGVYQSAEVTIPSQVVGTEAASIVNSTIPAVSDCPNAACNVISHSGI